MTKPIFISILLLTLTAMALGQKESSSPKTLEALIKTTSRIYDAVIRRDKESVDKYLANNFLETDATCKLRDKAWNLENLLGAEETLTYKIENPQVREYARWQSSTIFGMLTMGSKARFQTADSELLIRSSQRKTHGS